MAAVTAADIRHEFAEAATNPDLITRCVRICQDYKLSASDLAVQWDLLTMNGKGPKRMSIEMLSELESQARDEHMSKRARHEKAAKQQFTSRKTVGSSFNKSNAHLLSANAESPVSNRPSIGLTPTTSYSAPSSGDGPQANAFASRTDAGKVMCQLNPSAGMASSAVEVEVLTIAAPKPSAYNTSFMWEKLDERARLLDAQVAALEAALSERTDLPPLSPISATGPDEVTIVGRVCCEGEGKLNKESIYLEGSRATSNAFRVRLDLSGCPEFALFPGQIIGSVGVNSVGRGGITHSAKRILPALPPAASARPSASASAATDSPAVGLLVAAGPFTTSDDLAYAPLAELVRKASEERPDALILMGPFVDEQHPKLSSADLPITFEELFEQHIAAPLAELVELQLEKDDGRVTHVILIPSTKDIHHTSVYPQPPMPLPAELPEHVRPYFHMHANPSTFSVGDLRIAATSVDMVKLLSAQQLDRPLPPPAPKQDRMTKLASHMLQQRHLLPLFPAPSDERNPLPVDTVANLKAGGLPALPDILLIPSELKEFAKFGFGGVLCVNPGRLTRQTAGGNYAAICVHPPGKITPPKPVLEARDEAEQLLGVVDAPSPTSTDPADPPAAAAAAAAAASPGDDASSVKREVFGESGSQPSASEPAAAAADGSSPAPAAAAAADAPPAAAAASSSTAVSAAPPPQVAPSAATLTPPWLSPVDAPGSLEYRAYVEVKRI